jgi:ribosomal protein S18 acetylase RimI-like enzyme
MDDSIVVRAAEKRDLPELGRLGAMLMRTHYDFDRRRFLAPGAHPEEGYAWFLGTQLDEDGVVILVAEDRGEILGYVYAGVEEKSWKELRDEAGFIHDVAVSEAARRRGIAEQLIEAAARWLVARGVARVMLWTAEANAPAQQLFAKLGFRRTMIEMTRDV